MAAVFRDQHETHDSPSEVPMRTACSAMPIGRRRLVRKLGQERRDVPISVRAATGLFMRLWFNSTRSSGDGRG